MLVGNSIEVTRDGVSNLVLALSAEVTRCMVDTAAVALLARTAAGDEILIYVETRSVFTDGGGRRVDVDPESDPMACAPLLATLRQTIAALEVFPDGALVVTFANRDVWAVPPGDQFEAWNSKGPDSLRLVAAPDGELAIWGLADLGTSSA